MSGGDIQASRKGTSGGVIVAASIAAGLIAPVSYSLHKLGIAAVLNFFQQDTFYYLAIASKSTLGFFTFDGELPTSGFHPMWQVCVTLLFKLLGHAGKDTQMYAVFFLSVLLVIAGYCLTGLALYKITRSKLLGVLIIPGFFHIAFSFALRFGGSEWKYMNGMETCLSLLFGGLLLYFLSRSPDESAGDRDETKRYTIVGLITGLIVMARLDDVFLLISLAGAVLLLAKGDLRIRIRKTVILVMPGFIFLGWYMAYNITSVGAPLPISGLEKGGFSLFANIGELYRVLTPNVFIPGQAGVDLYLTDVYRQILMWFPILLSILFLTIWLYGPADRRNVCGGSHFVVGLLGYVILKGLYNLINVHANHQGLWYYALSVTIIDFMGLILLSRVYPSIVKAHRHVKIVAGVLLVGFLTFYVALILKGTLWGKPIVYNVYKNGPRIASTLLSIKPDAKLIEVDDGIFSYFLDIPAIHGMGFALDYPGFKARRRGRFLEYCLRRGFNTIASLQYLHFPSQNMSSDSIAGILRRSYHFSRENLNDFHFKVIYIDPVSGASFVAVTPKSGVLRQ